MNASLATDAEAPATAEKRREEISIPALETQRKRAHSHVASHWLPASFPPASSFTASSVPKCTACAGPAPRMTDDTPRHSARIPSVDDIRVNAFPTPL
jgi:hypothetical protein